MSSLRSLWGSNCHVTPQCISHNLDKCLLLPLQVDVWPVSAAADGSGPSLHSLCDQQHHWLHSRPCRAPTAMSLHNASATISINVCFSLSKLMCGQCLLLQMDLGLPCIPCVTSNIIGFTPDLVGLQLPCHSTMHQPQSR